MSRTQTRAFPVLILLMVLIAACGPSSYDLTVRVTQEDGTVIPDASVRLVGAQEVQMTDETGQVVWTDIEEDFAVLYVLADGFRLHTSEVDLERGHNETIILLQRAPIEPDELGP